MTTTAVIPKTIDGIKRLAKFIKKRDGIKHHEALNKAAEQAGFRNFKHAQNALLVKPLTSTTNRGDLFKLCVDGTHESYLLGHSLVAVRTRGKAPY